MSTHVFGRLWVLVFVFVFVHQKVVGSRPGKSENFIYQTLAYKKLLPYLSGKIKSAKVAPRRSRCDSRLVEPLSVTAPLASGNSLSRNEDLTRYMYFRLPSL